MIKNTKKIGVVGIIILSLLLTFPGAAQAQYVDIAQSVKEYALDPLAYFAANLVIKKIAASTVNWINNGFKGNPAYVTDPSQFFLNIADNTASQFLSTNGALSQLCTPFKAQVRLALVKNYLSDNNNYSCTLSKIKGNYDQFTQDFNQGGWDGWFEVTQNSANNPYGAYLAAETSLNTQINSQVKKYTDQLNQGRGFLSFETCPAGQEITNSASDQQYLDSGYSVGDCLVNKETVTPGSLIQDQLDKVIGSGSDRLVASDEIDEVVGALLNQLIGRVVGGIGNGLRGASQTGPNGTSYTDDLNNPTLEPQKPTNPVPEPSTDPVPVTVVDGGGSSPTVDPSSEPSSLGAVCAAVEEARSKFPLTITSKDQLGKILTDAVTKFTADGWGLLSKPAGNNCPISASGGPVACDIIFHKPSCLIYDVLQASDVGGPAKAVCSLSGSASRSRFVDVGGGGGGDTSQACVPVTTTGGTSPTPTPTPTPTTPDGPTITSVTPTIVSAGATTITISGVNLTTTVQFFDSLGNRNTVIGSLNSSNTQVTVQVPSDLKIGQATVKIYKDASTVSNGMLIQVTSSVSSGPEATPIIPVALKNLGDGTFPDVAFFNGRVYLAVQQNAKLLLYNWATDLTDQQVQEITYNGAQAFPKLTVFNNILWLAFRSGDNSVGSAETVRLWRSDTGNIEDIGGGLGNDPVAVQNGFVAWQKLQADGVTWKIVERALTGGVITVVKNASPTGISRILLNGAVVTIDEDRFMVSGHTRPWTAGKLTITEGIQDGLFGFWNNTSSPFTITGLPFSVFAGQESFTPHAATNGLVYAVTTWGKPGVRIAIIK